MHPLHEDLTKLTDSQIEQKILRLNSAYFMSQNFEVRQQIILLLDTYKLALEERRVAARKKQADEGKDDLDSLINVS